MRPIHCTVGEQSVAVQLFENPFRGIHGTFLDTRHNLTKNLKTLRQVRDGTRMPGRVLVFLRLFLAG
jgi:hypothetical protein